MNQEFEDLLSQLYQSQIGRRSFLLSVPILLAACSSVSAPPSAPPSELSVEEEKNMMKEALPSIRQNYPALKNGEIQSYVSSLGERIVKSAGLFNNPYEYSFVVVESSTVNAFALPAGRVFITAPLLAAVETEAELAGVLGHEIGHIESHHAAKRIQAQKNSRSQSWLYGTGGAVAGGLVGQAGASFICNGNSACTQQLVVLSAATGVGVGLLIQKHNFMANSQENELEADRLGFHLSQKAGFAAEHVGDFYRRLQKTWQESQSAGKTKIRAELFDSLSTHPPSVTRVQQMDQLIAAVSRPKEGLVTSTEFDQIRKQATSLGANREA